MDRSEIRRLARTLDAGERLEALIAALPAEDVEALAERLRLLRRHCETLPALPREGAEPGTAPDGAP